MHGFESHRLPQSSFKQWRRSSVGRVWNPESATQRRSFARVLTNRFLVHSKVVGSSPTVFITTLTVWLLYGILKPSNLEEFL